MTHVFWNRVHNDSSRSSEVIDFDTNQKPVSDFLLVLSSTLGLSCPISETLELLCSTKIHFFPYPTPIGKISRCSLWIRDVGSAKSEQQPMLTNLEIIF